MQEIDYERLYAKIADDLVTLGYSIITEALPLDLNKKLLGLCSDTSGFVQAAIVGGSDALVDTSRRSNAIRWLDEDMFIQSQFLGFARGLQLYLNRHLYLGLSYYESHFAIYKEGDFYEKHLDALKHSKNRVVTTVYYLDEAWSETDGGELIIYDEAHNPLQRVTPEAGTLVVFLSEKFPHEVLPTKRERHSIAGWFRIDKVA